MQMKSSYRVLKWMFVVGAMATLGSACVVTSGDGDDDDDNQGGEGGTDTTTAGKNSTAGTGGAATAGKNSGGTSTGGTDTGGTGDGGTGDGGTPSSYEPGLCFVDDPTSTSLPSCAHDAKDEDPANACRTCLKDKCCDLWQTCFGDTPTTACGWGPTEDADGQFECVRGCILEDMSGDDVDTVNNRCQSSCLLQCEDKDQGFVTDNTNELTTCGIESCLVECFTPE